MLGLGQRVEVDENKSVHEDLDGMVRAGIEKLSEANPFALAWSQVLPNIVNLVGGGVVGAGWGAVAATIDAPLHGWVFYLASVVCWVFASLLRCLFACLLACCSLGGRGGMRGEKEVPC